MKIERLKVTNEFEEVRALTPNEGLARCILIEWTFNGVIHKFDAEKSNNQLFIPILSRSQEEIIFFLKNYPEYPSPCNLIIMNGDATVRFHICPPDLISEQFKKYEDRVGKAEASKSIRLIQPDLYESTSSNILVIWIGFNYDWYEVRELDVKTGQFGKCLRAARL